MLNSLQALWHETLEVSLIHELGHDSDAIDQVLSSITPFRVSAGPESDIGELVAKLVCHHWVGVLLALVNEFNEEVSGSLKLLSCNILVGLKN